MTNTPKDEKEEVNYMQVGKKLECGHCHPEKFGEGLKELERVIPNYKCDCICHDTPSDTFIEDWKKELEKYCWNEHHFEPLANYERLEQFIDKLLKSSLQSQEKRVREEVEKEWREKIIKFQASSFIRNDMDNGTPQLYKGFKVIEDLLKYLKNN